MKILVIDDNIIHRNAAKKALEGHDLTIAKSFDEALELLGSRYDDKDTEYEVVLTDMNMPMSAQTISKELYDPEQEVAYGFVLALHAAQKGAKFVAMVTDTNHHRGAMSAALDHIGFPYYPSESLGGFTPNFVINGAKVMFIHAPLINDEIKDWGRILNDLLR